MGSLTGTCRLNRRVALSILKEDLGLKAPVGSQSNVEGRITEALKSAYEEIAEHVRNSNETKHIDETGWKRWKKRGLYGSCLLAPNFTVIGFSTKSYRM